MKVTVIDSATGVRHDATVAEDGKSVTIERCPQCGATPGVVVGIGGTLSHDHDTYRADAGTHCCDTRLGMIESEVSTIFGIDADEAFFRDVRCRVYDAPGGLRPGEERVPVVLDPADAPQPSAASWRTPVALFPGERGGWR